MRSKFKNDPLMSRVLRSSAHLFTSNTISLGLNVLMTALVFRLLGAAGSGLIALVMGYASTVNSLLSFRMSELVVRYGGEHLEKGEEEKASALIKAAGLTEAAVSVLAFLAVLISSVWASRIFTGETNSALLFIAFAVGLLANFNTETSTGILQVTGKIRYQGTINLIQSVLSLGIVAAAFFLPNQTWVVLLAYLTGKVVLGLGLFLTAQNQLAQKLGAHRAWHRGPLMPFSESRALIRFAVSSNISATIIKVFRESEPLWVGYFLSTEAVGYYKAAYSLVSFLSVPADPLIAATYPEINRLIVQKAWASLRSFLRKVTALAFAVNAAAALGFIFLGQFALILFTGHREFVAAYPTLLALFVGLAFNYTLFWNRPLLLALGLPDFPIWVTLVVGLVKVALAFWLVPQYGILAAGGLLSFYYIASVGVMAVRGVREIGQQENFEPQRHEDAKTQS
ncbi:MAG TPA: oligosaccharide flippase family protein [Anaerolineales bacterium]|nr:oligosaccharide flippase family protein [Anaerolineales bacterium]HNA55867.1 oligosaccharide flippase family protein [Anaerolineales bacterium]HNB87959.1 oligosaccharide flippase family protein [Anaerolineales bacterium]